MRPLRPVSIQAWSWLLRQRDAEQGRAVLWLPLFMGAGVLAYDAVRFEPWPWTGAAILAGATVLLAATHRWYPPRFVLWPVFAFGLGLASVQWATARALPVETALPSHATIVTGTVAAVEALPESRRITLGWARLDQAPPLARAVRIRLRPADRGPIATGDTVRVRAMVRPIGPPAYPGGWDMQRDAFYAGLGASGYALGPAERVVAATPSAPMAMIQRLREVISDRIAAAIPGPSGQVAVGILIGTQTGITPADMAAFRDSGLAHLLSVSGLHIAIVMGCMMAMVRFALSLSEHASLRWPNRSIAALAALGAGAFYTLLTGVQVPMVRCLLMAGLFTIALLAGRRPVSLRGLSIAAGVIVLVTPQEVAGASLQMSFSAVLALIAGFEALRPALQRLNGESWVRRSAAFLVGLTLTSLLAGTASLPFGAYHFGRVQVYYVLSNMIAVPLTSVVVMPAGMLALPLMLLDLEWLALLPVGWGIEATLWLARQTAALPGATMTVPHMTGWGLAVLSLGLAWLGLWQSAIRLFGVVLIAAGLLSPALSRQPDILVSGDGRLIAVRTAAGVFTQQAQNAGFVRDSWLHYWGEDRIARLPADGEAADGAIRCERSGCVLRPRADAPAALLVRTQDRRADCTAIAVVVASEPARGLCPRPWPALVDRFTVWRDGPAAIWLEPGGVRVLTDRAARGDRPWVPPPPTPRARPVPNLPLAPTEGGPDTVRKELSRIPLPEE